MRKTVWWYKPGLSNSAVGPVMVTFGFTGHISSFAAVKSTAVIINQPGRIMREWDWRCPSITLSLDTEV